MSVATTSDSTGRVNVAKNQNTTTSFDSLGADGAIAVIRRYYDAINKHHYRQAYHLWGNNGAASKQTFASFKRGYQNTDTVTLTVGKPDRIEGAAGSRYIRIPVKLTATTKKDAVQRFEGKYVLRRTVVDGSTAEQSKWHIYSAHLVREKKQ